MEFLYLTLLAAVIAIIWLKPEKERLAWTLFIVSSLICVCIFLGVEHGYLVPLGNI